MANKWKQSVFVFCLIVIGRGNLFYILSVNPRQPPYPGKITS